MKALGSFRGTIEDSGVSFTSGGFPQLNLKLSAVQMYDEAAKEWADWEEFWDEGSAEMNDRTIFAYLVLFGEKGATFNCDSVKAITGWEGDSFRTLAALDLVGTQIQWRNAENTYENRTTVQVAAVDLYDAAPGGSCKKIDDAEIAKLDAKFAEFLDGAKNKPEKAKSTRGRKPKTTAASEETAAPVEEPKKTGRRGRKPKVPQTEAAASAEVPAEAPAEAPTEEEVNQNAAVLFGDADTCTKQEAWTAACEGKKQDVTVDQLTKVWQKTIAAVAPGKSHANLTGEDWAAVKAGVLDEVS